MAPNSADETISGSREESLRKAMAQLERGQGEALSLSRPSISTGKTLFAFLLWMLACLCVSGGIVGVGVCFDLPPWVIGTAIILFLICVMAFKGKALICNAVLLYQKHAPEKLRRSCLFTPTCSEYMLLSIQKYGVARGCVKGIGRLCRCHRPNGGVDYP